MKYPNITLKIVNEVPVIEMHPSENESYRLAKADIGFDTLFLRAAEVMDVSEDELKEMLTDLRSADEYYLEFPEISLESDDVKLTDLINVVKEEVEKGMTYDEVPTDEVNDELKRNWQLDILASLQEAAYNLLIVRTVLIGSDLGIGEVRLDDSRKNTKLVEKMSQDLSQVGVELVVV